MSTASDLAIRSHIQNSGQIDHSISPYGNSAADQHDIDAQNLAETQIPSQYDNNNNNNNRTSAGGRNDSAGGTMDDYRNTMAPDLNRERNSKSAQSGAATAATGAGRNSSQADQVAGHSNNNGALVMAADSNVQLCGECGNDVATFECLDCAGEWYCRPCAIIVHSKGRRKSHAQFKEHPVCDICRSKLATLLCEKCDEVYCSTKCAYGAHDGSPRNGSKKRLHQWEALPAEGLPVQRPPHLEHAVDTRGGRNSFGIALTDLTMARYDGIDEDFEEVDGFLNEGDSDVAGQHQQIGGRDDHDGPQLLEMRDDPSRLSNRDDSNQEAVIDNNNSSTYNNNNNGGAGGDLVALQSALAGTQRGGKKDDGLNAEERIAAGKATESHFDSDSPIQNSRRARNEVHAAVAARNLPAPDLDEVVTLVTSADGKNAAGGRGDNNKNPIQHQGSSGALITNSVRGGKAAQLVMENGLTLIPRSQPIPERLLMAGLTDKLQAASEKRNAALMKKLEEGAARVAKLNDKIHGWRRWDVIHSEPVFFGSHPTPLIVNRPLPPLLPMLADLAADTEHDAIDTGFPSYVPFFQRSCGDDAFLLAVSSILASNGTQQVKTVRLEDGGDAENGIFTPRIRGGPVINVVAPGFDGPQQDDRQKKKKALEKADAAQPCPIGNIFASIFASCERLHDLGLATFRFFKPSTGEDMSLGAQRHLVPHRSAFKATNGVPPPVLDAVEHFVTVDTLFPVFEDGRPAFGRTDVPDEFWLALLEKAYATMKGPEGYASLAGGSPVDPLFSLCGGEPTQLQWGLQQLDSSAFAGGGADMVSPLAMRSRVVGLAWWMLQVATQYNLPICVTKRHNSEKTKKENASTTWYSLESGLDEVERFDWTGGDVVFFAVNHSIDRNLLDAQQYLDDEDDRSSAKSGASASNFNASFTRSHATGLSFGAGGGRAIQSDREEHRLVKLRQLYNTSRENDKSASRSAEPLLPLWHDGSNKWSDIASRVSGATGVAAFAARRMQGHLANKSVRSSQSNPLVDNNGSFSASSGAIAAGGAAGRRPPAGSSVKGYAESVLSRKDTQAGAGAGGLSMWTKSTRKTLQHNVADERLAWMDIDTFAQKYNTILIAQNMPQHKHHTFFANIDMRISENEIAKSLPHFLVVVEKRELENSDEADDRKWAEGLDSQFKSINDILKPPRSMKEDLGIGEKNETDDAAEEEAAAGNNNDDATSVASSQVSIAESLADMGTMGSRRSLVLRITVTQPTTKVDLADIVGGATNNTVSSANLMATALDNPTKGAASLMIEDNQSKMDALSSFKSVVQPEELTLYAFRVSEPARQAVTTSLGVKGEPVFSLPIHTKCPVSEISDPVAIGPVPAGLHQVTFEMEANPGAYNFVVAPTRGMGRTDLSNPSVSFAHFSMHICSVRNGENFEVKAGRV